MHYYILISYTTVRAIVFALYFLLCQNFIPTHNPFRHTIMALPEWIEPIDVYIYIYIYAYLGLALFCRGTMYTEYTIIKMMHADAGSSTLPRLLKYNHFRMAWYSYLGLLNINYSEGFTCTHCGSAPEALIMDATTLSFRKELDMQNLFFPQSKTLPLRAGR